MVFFGASNYHGNLKPQKKPPWFKLPAVFEASSDTNAEALDLSWLQAVHGTAGLLVHQFSASDHCFDELIMNLNDTVVCQQSYDTLARVYADFVSDIPDKVELVQEAIACVLESHAEFATPARSTVAMPAPATPVSSEARDSAPETPVPSEARGSDSGTTSATRRHRIISKQPPSQAKQAKQAEQVANVDDQPDVVFVVLQLPTANVTIRKIWPAESETKIAMGEVSTKTLTVGESMAATKNRAFACFRVKRRDGHEISEADLQEIAAKNSFVNFFAGASCTVAYFVAAKPATFNVGFESEISFYTFPAGGNSIAKKVGSLLLNIMQASSITHGTFAFKLDVITELTWESAIDMVKDCKPADWLKMRAEAKRAVKYEKADNVQQAIHMWQPELSEFLKHLWNTTSTCRPVNLRPPAGQRFKDLPLSFRQATTRTFIDDQIVKSTISDHQSSEQCMKSTLVILGPANVGKTSATEILANRQCCAVKKTIYGMVQELDQFGSLTLTGCTDKMGAYVTDDADFVLKAGWTFT